MHLSTIRKILNINVAANTWTPVIVPENLHVKTILIGARPVNGFVQLFRISKNAGVTYKTLEGDTALQMDASPGQELFSVRMDADGESGVMEISFHA